MKTPMVDVLDRYRLEDGTYILSGSKSVPAFKPGAKGKANKWITLYAYMVKEMEQTKYVPNN